MTTPAPETRLHRKPYLSYFNQVQYPTWDIVTYLQFCKNRVGPISFNFELAINLWQSHLRETAKSSDKDAALRAETLLDRYRVKGRQSDSARAREFLRAQRKTKDRRQRAMNPQACNDNYGTLILANNFVNNADINLAPRPVIPPPVRGHSGGSTSSGSKPPQPSRTSARQRDRRDKEPQVEDTHLDGLVEDDIVSRANSEEPSDAESVPEDNDTPPPDLSDESSGGLDLGPGSDSEGESVHSFPTDLSNTECKIRKTVLRYGQGIKEPNLAHFSIIDPGDKKLMYLLKKEGFSPRRLAKYYAMPEFPPVLKDYLEKYNKASNVFECRSIAAANTEDWSTYPPDIHFCRRWIDRAAETVMSLITESHNLLKQDLGEGAWEGIYWNIVDFAFINLPFLMLQRRDTYLQALALDPGNLRRKTRFDGIFRTREIPKSHSARLEFGVIEVSREYEHSDSLKWNTDMGKLYSACRSMLGALKFAVGNDPSLVSKLAVVGILQAGRVTLVLVMSSVGEETYFLRRGKTWLLPIKLEEFGYLSSLLNAIWKAREIMKRSYETVMSYVARENPVSPLLYSDPEFL